jgi:hypothetical protein
MSTCVAFVYLRLAAVIEDAKEGDIYEAPVGVLHKVSLLFIV